MQEQKNVIDCYDKTAKNYADHYINELEKKHLDRILLSSFASENRGKGKLIDLGCGPGQTTKFLFDCGMTDVIGTDISPNMIHVAKELNPNIQFDVADMLSLKFRDKSFSSAIAFYSIVHFNYEQIKTAFKEIKRVLMKNGQFLFSFHIGEDTVHLDSFLEQKVNIDFYFLNVDKIKALLMDEGFEVVDVIERQAYKEVEYPSKRAYIWVRS